MANRSTRPRDGAANFLLRLPGDIYDRIGAAAKASGRSMNAEIVAILEETMNRSSELVAPLESPEHAAEARALAEKSVDKALARADVPAEVKAVRKRKLTRPPPLR